MVNEVGWIWEWLDIWWAPREDVNNVTEEAVRRIQEQAKQAKQIWQEIKQDKAINNKLAEFLWFLMKTLNNDHLVKHLYELFFKIKNPKTGITYLRKKINIFVITWLFYPFYVEQWKELGVDTFFESLLHHNNNLDLTHYIKYIKKLSEKYHDNVPLDQEILLELLVEIINHFEIFKTKELAEEKYQEFVLHLKNELYK